MPHDPALVVGEGAVGEGVVGLLGVAAALEEQQQRLVPGRLAGRSSPPRSAARCPARSPPRPRSTGARAPRGTSCRACRAGRRRCRRRSARDPRPSTSRTASSSIMRTTVVRLRGHVSGGPSGVPTSRRRAGHGRRRRPREDVGAVGGCRAGRHGASDRAPSVRRTERAGSRGVRWVDDDRRRACRAGWLRRFPVEASLLQPTAAPCRISAAALRGLGFASSAASHPPSGSLLRYLMRWPEATWKRFRPARAPRASRSPVQETVGRE